MSPIWLIGMPSSGKSTICKLCGGVDTDDIINLQELVATSLNPDDFYTKESNAIIDFIKKNDTLDGVFATGGSVVHKKSTMEYIQQNGIIIWLYCPLNIIKKRLGDYSKRGIMMPDGITTLDGLFEYRANLYAKYADIHLDTSKNSLDDCVKFIQDLTSDYQELISSRIEQAPPFT